MYSYHDELFLDSFTDKACGCLFLIPRKWNRFYTYIINQAVGFNCLQIYKDEMINAECSVSTSPIKERHNLGTGQSTGSMLGCQPSEEFELTRNSWKAHFEDI